MDDPFASEGYTTGAIGSFDGFASLSLLPRVDFFEKKQKHRQQELFDWLVLLDMSASAGCDEARLLPLSEEIACTSLSLPLLLPLSLSLP